jgi:hypothetical protein
MALFVLAYVIAELLLPTAPATVLAGSVYRLALGSALVVLLARRLLPGSAASQPQARP